MSLDLTGFDTEQDLREGEYNPPEPGIYHLAVAGVDVSPVSKGGEALDGIQVTFQVLDGTVKGMQGREFRQLFFFPQTTAKDGGKFATKRLAMLGLATEVIDPSQLGKAADPNWEDMMAKHFVAEVATRDEKYTEIKGLAIWHVNHPDAARYPKDKEVLEAMPMAWKPDAPPPQSPPAAGSAATPKAGPKPGAPRPGVKRPAAAAANGGGTATATAAAPAKAADPYGDL